MTTVGEEMAIGVFLAALLEVGKDFAPLLGWRPGWGDVPAVVVPSALRIVVPTGMPELGLPAAKAAG